MMQDVCDYPPSCQDLILASSHRSSEKKPCGSTSWPAKEMGHSTPGLPETWCDGFMNTRNTWFPGLRPDMRSHALFTLKSLKHRKMPSNVKRTSRVGQGVGRSRLSRKITLFGRIVGIGSSGNCCYWMPRSSLGMTAHSMRMQGTSQSIPMGLSYSPASSSWHGPLV